MPTERKVTLEQFQNILDEQNFSRRIDEVVVHHTWKPTSTDYRGESTVRGVRLYHMNTRGWSDNGYHVMIAPNRDIWLCRPMSRSGAHVLNRNAHTIGVSYIANFDAQSPSTYEGFATGQKVVTALCRRFNLPVEGVRFHREFASKSCPGNKVDIDTYQEVVSTLLAMEDEEDLDFAEWARYAVEWAQTEGLIVGRTDGLFHGFDPCNRQEMAIIIYRLQKWLKEQENAT